MNVTSKLFNNNEPKPKKTKFVEDTEGPGLIQVYGKLD